MAIVIEGGIGIGPGISIGGSSGPAPTPTLLLELDAADYSGSGTTWPAAVGSNATLYNTPTYTASSPTYFSFNKASFEYADSADLGNLSTWTVEAWFRVTSSLTGQITYVVGNQFDLSSNINFGIGTVNAPSNYNIAVGLYDNGWENTAGFAPTLNTWYYVVGTYDGSTIKQYVNGTLTTSLSYSGTPASGGTVRIARRWDSSGTSATNFFPGDIAIARVSSGAIDATAVTNNWNSEKTRFGYAAPGVDNVVGYNEMPPPVTAGGTLEDGTATINGSTGFTINSDQDTGVAITGLTASNQAWFTANYPTVPGTYTCTWGPGSTVASSNIFVVQTGTPFVFFIQGQTGAATYNYPFTFGV